ncbi:discoidin domain-containing protein [Jatrophihabitans sp. YIM 134969]
MSRSPSARPSDTHAEPARGASRRAFLTGGATLLAGWGVAAAWPGSAEAAPAGPPAATRRDLALFRPATASSTAYAATPASFAVDELSEVGVRGSGWRAGGDGPASITVDLQASCTVEAVTLTFEALASDPPFDGDYGQTDGSQVLSSAATAFTVEVSTDTTTWKQVYATTSGPGGVVAITLDAPVKARWVRMTATAQANANPVGLNGFQVWGTTTATRPPASGWTSWDGLRRSAPALTVAADGSVPLESGWELTLDDFAGSATGADLAAPRTSVERWLPATVPGTVLTSLVEQERFPDPVEGFANLEIPEALSRHAWWYRRVFALPRGLDTSSGRHVWLEFDGINHQADVWLNGTNVGTLVHPFARARWDVTSALAAGGGQHGLAVKITPMPHPGNPGDKSDNGNTFVQGGHLYLDSPTYLASSGWDWMPAVRDRASGIWNHVRLRSTGAVVIGDPQIDTTLPNLPAVDVARVRVVVPVRNVGAKAKTVTVRIAFDRVSLAQQVTVPATSSTDVVFDPDQFAPLMVKNPELWWPNGYGEPALHDLSVTVSSANALSDTRTVQFGIRQFDFASAQPIVVPPSAAPTFIVSSGSTAPGQIVDLGPQNARFVRVALGRRATGYGFSMYRLAVVNSVASNNDLAEGHTATASSQEDDGHSPALAVDGDPTTRFASGHEDHQWIQVDLGATTAFDQVQIAWESAYALDYVVQVSADGAAWTDVQSVDNAAALGDSAVQTESFPPTTARWLRIQGHKRATGYGISMWRLSVLDSTDPDTDLALHQPATASSDDGNPAGNATDDNPRTRWSSSYTDDQWIQVDLGAARVFDQVQIDWEQAYARTFVIQASDDGQTWTDVKAVDNSVTQLRISVNGVPVFARGGNWGWDELLRRTEGRLETAVRMHRDMNFTMVRNWLGSSDREELYALCDRYGLLVWNDFWEAGTFLDDIPGYVDIAADTIRRYRTHPSIVVWCGANEEEPPLHLGQGMAAAVTQLHPGTLYVPNSAGGVVSGHGPYRWIEPAAYYDRDSYDTGAFGFHTEIGMPVVPVTETMQNLVGDEPGWPITEVWNHHDWSPTANQQTASYQAAIDARLGASSTLDEFCRRAQFVNYENHRAMFEAWNANLTGDATALLLWMSHPAWYSTVWQTYDYDFDVNGAYYGARSACEPVHVQASLPDWTVKVANNTTRQARGVVTATLYALDGTVLRTLKRAVTVGPTTTGKAFAMPFKANLPALHLLRLEFTDRARRVVSRNTYWRYRKPTDMQVLTTGAPTRLVVSTAAMDPAGGDARRSVAVRNAGTTVAAMVRLSVRDAAGKRVLPAFYDDNYFWLLPGESRTVTVSWPAATPVAGGPRVWAQAYNAPRVGAR